MASMLLLASVVVVSLLAGLVLGGRFSGFERIHLRLWWLAPVGLAMQLAPASNHGLALGLLLGSYVVLLAFGLANIRLAGFALIVMGLLANFLVISVNSGMPVTRSALLSSGQADTLSLLTSGQGTKHHLAGSGEVLLPLADVIPVGTPFHQVMSVGDLFVYAGMLWFVVAVMRRPRAAD